jgi:hypothetical protein
LRSGVWIAGRACSCGLVELRRDINWRPDVQVVASHSKAFFLCAIARPLDVACCVGAFPAFPDRPLAALSEAEEFINKQPGEAAQIYIKTTNDKRSSDEEMIKFISNPENI